MTEKLLNKKYFLALIVLACSRIYW